MNEELKAGFETGNLRLVRRIGAGGMGTVWLAEHLTLRTRVAVKFLTDPALYSDAIGLERFAREAEVLARIKSPYIVQVLDRAMTNSGVPYLVLELLEGETLSKHIARNGGASLEVTRRVVEHVGKALAKAHALGVVHRDVKPDNIYLATADDGLVCKVFDFGVAKEHGGGAGDPLTGSGSMVGTPSYMSPEQFADSGVVDHHVDLWSLAVVAYIALTGSRPFTGSDLVELCRNVLRGRYIPPSQREGARVDPVPGRVDAWFQRAFAPHRAQRFSSATEMVDAFLDALGDVGSGEPLSDELADMLLASSLPGLPEPARSSGARRSPPRGARSARNGGSPGAGTRLSEPTFLAEGDVFDHVSEERTRTAVPRQVESGQVESGQVESGQVGSTRRSPEVAANDRGRVFVGVGLVALAVVAIAVVTRVRGGAATMRGESMARDVGTASTNPPAPLTSAAVAPTPGASPTVAPSAGPSAAAATASLPSEVAAARSTSETAGLRAPKAGEPARALPARSTATPLNGEPNARSKSRRTPPRDLDYVHGF